MSENLNENFILIDSKFDRLKDDNVQQELMETAQAALFADQQVAENTYLTINHFVDDYLQNGRNQPLDQWLIGRFNQYPDIWQDEQEKIDTANIIISTIDSLISNQAEVENTPPKANLSPIFYIRKSNKSPQKPAKIRLKLLKA